MRKLFNRITGTLLIIAALVGLVFSLAGIAGMWGAKARLTRGILDSLNLFSSSLDTTAQGLVMVQQSFSTLTSSISSAKDTLAATANTIETTKPMLTSLQDLVDDDLPGTVAAVQTSLQTAQESAKIIDTVLRALTIFNRDSYNPQVPLHESLQSISVSMDDLPQAFSNIQTSLKDASDQADVIQADLVALTANMTSIENTMQDYEKLLTDFQVSLNEMKQQMDSLKANLRLMIDAGVWVLTIFLAWMAIAQLGLLTQGWELLHRAGPAAVASPPAEKQAAAEPEIPAPDQK